MFVLLGSEFEEMEKEVNKEEENEK